MSVETIFIRLSCFTCVNDTAQDAEDTDKFNKRLLKRGVQA